MPFQGAQTEEETHPAGHRGGGGHGPGHDGRRLARPLDTVGRKFAQNVWKLAQYFVLFFT